MSQVRTLPVGPSQKKGDVMDVKNVKAWTHGVPVEYEAINQVRALASLPILARHVAVMPDVHVSKGATVGSVIPTRGAIIPAAVGVDIGCGMVAVKTTLTADELPDSLAKIRAAIEAVVPVGFNHHSRTVSVMNAGLQGMALHCRMKSLDERFEQLRILKRYKKFDYGRVWKQLGTLGGGNHFIEICLDEQSDVWVMLHSGSRNVGKTIGEIAIGMAKEIAVREKIGLPDKDLAWLSEGSVEFEEYVEGLQWAQDYAALNRDLMLLFVMKSIKAELGREIGATEHSINCHHNYASLEEHGNQKMWVTRKGAVSAKAGELGIIPGSMGARSYITRGLGNADSYCSCSHGAGRRMSRGAASRAFTVDDLVEQTAGVECRKDADVIDEIPQAYKDIDAVMAAQTDLVEKVHTLKQILCLTSSPA
jgi:tRNA-splicing ligase RtcB